MISRTATGSGVAAAKRSKELIVRRENGTVAFGLSKKLLLSRKSPLLFCSYDNLA